MDIEIRKYLRLVIRWWWLLIVSAVIPAGISYYFASQQPDLYQAKATVMVGLGLLNPDPDPLQMNLSNTLAAAYAELLRQGPVTESVIERLGLERSPEQLAAQIGTRIYSGAQLLEIQVSDNNPQAAAVIANALAEEIIRRSPASGGGDPAQQEFIRNQLEEVQLKIGNVSRQIDDLTASLSELTSAAEIQEAQDRIASLEDVKSTYQAAYADLIGSYRAESPNAVSLFDPAVVPQWPIPSKIKLIVAVAGAAGLGLALSAIFLMEYLDTSLRLDEGGVQFMLGLPVLGVVPRVSKKQASLSGAWSNPVAEGVRAMRANVFLMRPDDSFRTLLLTSPGSSEGKSFILAHLARVLSLAGNRVIVVDADMRRPSLHVLFDRPNFRGLADVLDDLDVGGENDLSIPLQETSFENVYLLSAGRLPVDPNALLTSPQFPPLLESLRGQGDVILIDSPPVLHTPDATVLATVAEATILVASVGRTRREWVEQARDRLLAQQGTNLLGLVLNRARLNGNVYYGLERGREEAQWREGDGGEPWLKLREVAVYLGVSRAMVRRWCKTGRLTARRSGLGLQINRDDLAVLVQPLMGGGEIKNTEETEEGEG